MRLEFPRICHRDEKLKKICLVTKQQSSLCSVSFQQSLHALLQYLRFLEVHTKLTSNYKFSVFVEKELKRVDIS